MACEPLYSDAVNYQIHLERSCCHCRRVVDRKSVWPFQFTLESSYRPMRVVENCRFCSISLAQRHRHGFLQVYALKLFRVFPWDAIPADEFIIASITGGSRSEISAKDRRQRLGSRCKQTNTLTGRRSRLLGRPSEEIHES